MDSTEYKEKKLDKLTRDVVHLVNKCPSFGYGDVVDALAKNAMTGYLLSIVSMAEVRENDTEILAQSIMDDLSDLSNQLVTKISEYKQAIKDNA